MIELYHCADARSFRVLWLLEELKRPYRLHTMEFPPKATTPAFLERNPLGTVPLLVDGETTMFESAAILQYLVARHGPTPLDVKPDEPAFADFLNWLHLGEAGFAVHLAVMMRYTFFEPEARRIPQVVATYGEFVAERFALIDRALQNHEFICADRFTLADISVGYALMLSRMLRLQERWTPGLVAYWDRLRKRPAFGAAKDAQKAATAG